jgi:sugar phosphate isomerase/epimerase
VSAVSFAVSTFLFHASRLDREHLVDIAAHGFGGVELFALRSHFDYADPTAVADLAEWLDDTRLQLTAVHAPTAERVVDGVWTGTLSVASTDAALRARAVAEIQQTLDLAAVLPFRTLVLHVGMPAHLAAAGDNDAGAARHSLDVIVPYAAERGVQVALEVQTNALSTPDALVALIEDATDWPPSGICLDVGHARLLGDPADAIETASGLIVASHVHDTRGSRDDHLVPYEGSIEWARTLLAFQKVGYSGPWTFELAPAASPIVATLARAVQARQRFEQCLGINDELMSQ